MRPQVWITGVGVATSLGFTYSELADNLLAGQSGIGLIRRFDVSEHPSQIGAELNEIPCPAGWCVEEFTALTRQEQTSLWCSISALQDAGLWEIRHSLRIGLVLGIGAEWMCHWENDSYQGGSRLFEPDQDEPHAHKLARWLELSGPVVSLSAACASGNYALAQARRWLQMGWVDVCLAGACDTGLTPMSLAGFGNLRALSRRNGEPQSASRPFDQKRDGFVMGEGGALFVLEREETARQRSARVYASVAGCGASSDAHNMVIPNPDPEPALAAMRQALDDARLLPEEVDYVNAHATSTPVGDAAESRILQMLFGDKVSTIPVSSTKSMTGHLLTAAAAVEAVACLVALDHQAIPPTINLDDPDPECDLCHVAGESRAGSVGVGVSNSFGFGGSNTCLVLAGV